MEKSCRYPIPTSLEMTPRFNSTEAKNGRSGEMHNIISKQQRHTVIYLFVQLLLSSITMSN